MEEARLPRILMQLLNDESCPAAIWWLADENEFAVNSEVFPAQVLDVHFEGINFASFSRKLRNFGGLFCTFLSRSFSGFTSLCTTQCSWNLDTGYGNTW